MFINFQSCYFYYCGHRPGERICCLILRINGSQTCREILPTQIPATIYEEPQIGHDSEGNSDKYPMVAVIHAMDPVQLPPGVDQFNWIRNLQLSCQLRRLGVVRRRKIGQEPWVDDFPLTKCLHSKLKFKKISTPTICKYHSCHVSPIFNSFQLVNHTCQSSVLLVWKPTCVQSVILYSPKGQMQLHLVRSGY